MLKKIFVTFSICLIIILTCCKNKQFQDDSITKQNINNQNQNDIYPFDVIPKETSKSNQIDEFTNVQPGEEIIMMDNKNNKQNNSNQPIIELTDKTYVAYINEIFFYPDDYLGRTLKLQGEYKYYTYEVAGHKQTVNYVFRNGPGCCGNDGSMCGFEFTWNGNKPKDGDWIEVTGILSTYEIENLSIFTLDASEVKVLDTHGKLNVTN